MKVLGNKLYFYCSKKTRILNRSPKNYKNSKYQHFKAIGMFLSLQIFIKQNENTVPNNQNDNNFPQTVKESFRWGWSLTAAEILEF